MSRLAEARRHQPGADSPAGEPAAAPVTTPPLMPPPDHAAGNSQTSLLAVRESGQPAPASPPFYRRGWFWAGVGGVVVLGAAAAALTLSSAQPQGTLPPIDARAATSMP